MTRLLACAALACAMFTTAPANAHPVCPTGATCALLHAVCGLHSGHCEIPAPATPR